MRRTDLIRLTASAVPIAFAVPLVAGVAVSLHRLVSSPQPLPGFIGGGINADALALYHGFGLYHDPATGYLGSAYTPGLALLVSMLDRLTMWSGWVPLICYLASFPIAGLAGWLACRNPGTSRFRLLTAAEGIGFAALSWWLLSTLQNPSLYSGHVDHPAWVLALGGLVIVPAAARGSRPALLGVIALFTLALWTKQTAVAAPIAGLAWLALRGPTERRTALVLGAALLAINAVILAILSATTDGWAWRQLVAFGAHQPVYYDSGFIAREFLREHALVLLCGGALWSFVLLPRLRRGSSTVQPLRHDTRAHLSLIAIFVVVAGIVAFQARRVQGGQDNDYIPVTWGLIFLMALGYQVLRSQTWGHVAAAAPLAVLLALAGSPWLRTHLTAHGIRVPPTLHPAVSWASATPGVGPPSISYPRGAYYDWTGTVLGRDLRGRPYAPVTGILGALAVGRSPSYFLDALLSRRFSGLQLFPQSFESDGIDDFASADGRYEQHFFWKLNEVIASRYASAPSGPAGILVPRSGPEPDRWMRTCFAPLRYGDVDFFIGQGGGFWCHLPGAGARLTLVDTPSAYSEAYTRRRVKSLRGELGIGFSSGTVNLTLGRGTSTAWELQLTRTSATRVRAICRPGKRRLPRVIVSFRRRTPMVDIQVSFADSQTHNDTVTVSSGAIRVTMSPLVSGLPLSVSASRGSHAKLQLGRLVLT